MAYKPNWRQIVKAGAWTLAFILLIGGAFYASGKIEAWHKANDTTKQRKVQDIMQTAEFKQKAADEAERMYYRQLLDEATKRLEELEGGGFQPEATRAAALVAYFESKGADDLVPYAPEIALLARWSDVVAIVAHETSLCTKGVGKSKNNCGAVKNGRTGEFKRYASKLDAFQDVAALLAKPQYAGKSIAEMNGTYCVDELNDGNKCAGWTESIELTSEEIKILAYGG